MKHVISTGLALILMLSLFVLVCDRVLVGAVSVLTRIGA